MCLFKRRSIAAYRQALLCEAFSRGCAATSSRSRRSLRRTKMLKRSRLVKTRRRLLCFGKKARREVPKKRIVKSFYMTDAHDMLALRWTGSNSSGGLAFHCSFASGDPKSSSAHLRTICLVRPSGKGTSSSAKYSTFTTSATEW